MHELRRRDLGDRSGGADAQVKIISFAWTTPALLAGRKTVTRRDWSDRYALLFHADDFVAGYNRSPRHGGRRAFQEFPARCPLPGAV